jgi:hypothetical protein
MRHGGPAPEGLRQTNLSGGLGRRRVARKIKVRGPRDFFHGAPNDEQRDRSMSKRQPPTDDTVINLQDVRKRIEGEAKRSGKSIHDMLHEIFGTAFGFPPGPYAEALQRQRQRQEQQEKAYAEQIGAIVKRDVVDPAMQVIDDWKNAYKTN